MAQEADKNCATEGMKVPEYFQEQNPALSPCQAHLMVSKLSDPGVAEHVGERDGQPPQNTSCAVSIDPWLIHRRCLHTATKRSPTCRPGGKGVSHPRRQHHRRLAGSGCSGDTQSLLVCMSPLASQLRVGSVACGRPLLSGRGSMASASSIPYPLRRQRTFRKLWRKLSERKP